jgi:Fe(3+) dicitrate transport protein
MKIKDLFIHFLINPWKLWFTKQLIFSLLGFFSKNIFKHTINIISFHLIPLLAFAQTATIKGRVQSIDNQAVEEAVILLKNTDYKAYTDKKGYYLLSDIPYGSYTLVAFAYGKNTQEQVIEVNQSVLEVNFSLEDLSKSLNAVEIQAAREKTFGLTRLRGVENFGIYEGKKTEVIVLQDITANLATNNPRQVYARITGLNIWESDQAGLQLGIGGRGLNPNRTSNFNTRQNGYDISADALGYPESYYTPPTEALERIEIIRGAASLQYGTQFGGMLNFKFKKGAKDKKIELISRQSVGSWGFLGTFNSLGGQIGKFNYYTYFQYRQGNGFRPNSAFDFYNAYASLTYDLTNKFSVNLDLTKMNYLTQQAGGLTDKNFQDNPRQSVRKRNWFKVDWNLLALNFTYKFTDQTQLNVRNFGLLARRQSVGNLERINVTDFGGNRTLIDGEFKNFGNEIRLLHKYHLGNQNHTFLAGSRIYKGTTSARQGDGSNGSDANFNYLNPNNLENSDYLFPNWNYALFIENIFQINPKFSLTPGIRYENIQTFANGYYKQYVTDGAGNIIVENRFDENLNRKRSFVLLGLGASYQVNPKVELYGNISQNYRAINFTDLRIVNQNIRIDPNIQDEKGFTADLGVRGNVEDVFTYEMTLFYLAYQDKIGQLLQTDPVLFNDFRFRTNVADARNVGLEAFGEVNLLKLINPMNKTFNWSVFSNFSWIDARYINTEDNTIKNNQVEMVPAFTLKLGNTLKYKSFSTTLQFSHTSEHFSDASNARRTATAIEGLIPAYQVVDLSASYQWKFLTLECSINNLLNEKYFTRRAESYPGPGIIPADGRGFYITLQGRF